MVGGDREAMGPMLSYGMVARGHAVLSEFTHPTTVTNAGAIARQILDDLPSDIAASFSHRRHVFHVNRNAGITVLCMADDSLDRRIAFGFLQEIHQQFASTYGIAVQTAAPYAMNEEFSRVLSREMDRRNADPDADRLNRLKGEMSQVRTVVINNIEKVLERGDRLALLVEKASALQQNTRRFRRQSRRLKSTMWWGNFKLTGALLLILAIIVYVALAFLCGGPFMRSCLSKVLSIY